MHWVESDFFQQTFEETLALLEEARNHIDMASHGGLDSLPTEVMLETTRDLSYLTSQLTGVMSLLLLHKSVSEGGLAEEDFPIRSKELVAELKEIEEALAGPHGQLAPTVQSLIERGDRLSQRVHRIQDMLKAGAA